MEKSLYCIATASGGTLHAQTELRYKLRYCVDCITRSLHGTRTIVIYRTDSMDNSIDTAVLYVLTGEVQHGTYATTQEQSAVSLLRPTFENFPTHLGLSDEKCFGFDKCLRDIG